MILGLHYLITGYGGNEIKMLDVHLRSIIWDGTTADHLEVEPNLLRVWPAQRSRCDTYTRIGITTESHIEVHHQNI